MKDSLGALPVNETFVLRVEARRRNSYHVLGFNCWRQIISHSTPPKPVGQYSNRIQHRTMRSWRCRHQNASLLSVRRYNQYSISYGINWRRFNFLLDFPMIILSPFDSLLQRLTLGIFYNIFKPYFVFLICSWRNENSY